MRDKDQRRPFAASVPPVMAGQDGERRGALAGESEGGRGRHASSAAGGASVAAADPAAAGKGAGAGAGDDGIPPKKSGPEVEGAGGRSPPRSREAGDCCGVNRSCCCCCWWW